MVAPARRWQLAGLVLTTVLLTAGCNPLTLPFFLMWGLDPKIDPECKLATDKKKDTKVVILTYCPIQQGRELHTADRELTSLLATRLQESAKRNKEKLTVISPSKVQRYKDEHPNWKTGGAEEVGKYFDADYVIDLEITALSLYLPNSHGLLSGKAEISLVVVDMSDPEEPIFKKEYATEYPKSRGPVPVSDTTPQQFRLQFLGRVATDLSWCFTAHPVDEHFPCD